MIVHALLCMVYSSRGVTAWSWLAPLANQPVVAPPCVLAPVTTVAGGLVAVKEYGLRSPG